MKSIVILGAGEAGTRAGFALREVGYQGAITLVGAEQGAPYERPPLSKPEGSVVAPKPICSEADLAAAGIVYLAGTEAQALDPAAQTVLLSNGQTLHFDRALLATGARPRPLAGARSLRSLADAEAIFASTAQSVILIGAGLIGMELAAQLRTQGRAVRVLEMGPRILGRAVPEPFANALLARHLAEGVEVDLNIRLREITPTGVTLESGAQLPAELVIAAIGVLPETRLAEAAGLACDNGIRVSAQMQSSHPAIFAAGDCAHIEGFGRFEMWQTARDSASCAARNMLGANEPFAALPWFWSDQYDLSLQVLGTPNGTPLMRQFNGGELALYCEQGRLTAAAGLSRGATIGREIALARRLIANGKPLDPLRLTDPNTPLKDLLK